MDDFKILASWSLIFNINFDYIEIVLKENILTHYSIGKCISM